ncbi:proline-rich domain-containing protein [Streptomyces virginiae]|uniref:TrbL/VirB6 plasmid conjugal transfer protein n=1 Tax=Streptomyces virginiae TaxID=1961 RepID=A0ABZ1TU83_STRVG|nr:proline-rich domain-containing protein [Streptomyces virginiae]
MSRCLPRGRTLALPLMAVVTTLAVTTGAAHAETVDPDGVGGLLPAPLAPTGGGTIYETYPHLLTWRLDKDFGQFDFLDPALHMIADVLLVVLVTIGSAVSTLAGWAFGMTDLPEVQGPLTQAISGSAGAVMAGLFPSALAVGGLVAFLRAQRGDGGGFTDLSWVLVSAVAAATLLTTPQVWVDGVNSGRMLGTEVAMSATDAGIGAAGGGIEKTPFALGHTTTYPGDASDRVVRRATDTVWRVYVGMPWCLAEFGSMKLCQEHGRQVLDLGTDLEKRKEYLRENLDDEDVGAESQSYRQGHRPLERAGVLVVAVPVALLFGLLLIVLLFGSIAAMMAALFLLVVGPLFAALWVIPGRPRQWGVRWADALVGAVMQSAITTLTAGAVMIIQMVTALAMPTYGWLGCSALSIAGAVSAFKYRSILTGIVGGAGPTGGGGAGALLGALATRGLSRHAGRVLRTPGRLSRRLGDAVERRHRPPAPPLRPGRPRPPAPPPPPPPTGGRPPRPSSGTGPGRGTGPGGTGPGTTLAAAGRRSTRAASAGAPRGAQQAPVQSTPPRTVPPSRQGQQTPAHSPTARTLPAPTNPVSQQLPGGPMRMPPTAGSTPNRARKATQPPAPSAGNRRAQTPPPRTPRLRTGRRVPPPPPRGWTQPPLPQPPPHT